MSELRIWGTILVIAAVTAAIRFAPFVLFSGKRKTPAILDRLGKVLPYAEMGMLVVDPFGKVFSCWDVVGKDDQATGYIQPGMSRFLWNFNKAKWRTRTVDLIPACQSCPYAFICRGGCASRSSNAYSDYFREFCGEIREVFAFTASRLAGQEWEKRRAEIGRAHV